MDYAGCELPSCGEFFGLNELLLDSFEQVMDAGPLARERCMKMKVSLMDMKLHEDAIHRGPAQVYPAVRDALYMAMSEASAGMFEPLQVDRKEVRILLMGPYCPPQSGRNGMNLARIHPIIDAVALAADVNKSGVAQHRKMPGNAGLRHFEHSHKLINCKLLRCHQAQDAQPHALGKGFQRSFHGHH